MTQPLAFVFYEKLLPGSQVVNRLQDLGYQARVFHAEFKFLLQAEQEKPLLALVDLSTEKTDSCLLIARLRNNEKTAHLPVIAFGGADDAAKQKKAQEAGATLVAGNAAMLNQLPELLEHALQVE